MLVKPSDHVIHLPVAVVHHLVMLLSGWEKNNGRESHDLHALDFISRGIELHDAQRGNMTQLPRQPLVVWLKLPAMAAPRRIKVHQHILCGVLYRSGKCCAHKHAHPASGQRFFSAGLWLAPKPGLQGPSLVITNELHHGAGLQALHGYPVLARGVVRPRAPVRLDERHDRPRVLLHTRELRQAPLHLQAHAREADEQAAPQLLGGLAELALQLGMLFLADEKEHRRLLRARVQDLRCNVLGEVHDHRCAPRRDPPIQLVDVLELAVVDSEALVMGHEHDHRGHRDVVALLASGAVVGVAALELQQLLPAPGAVAPLHLHQLALDAG
mmetsp:Transcript_48279/g.154158  ORF Transcript_48279/g.154158 Transcript_48279/m.154158 type:complete len:327 (-) Transcript_48279:819-1799(-)